MRSLNIVTKTFLLKRAQRSWPALFSFNRRDLNKKDRKYSNKKER